MPCKYGPVFALYLYRIESNRVNTVQKQVRIYMAFFLCVLYFRIDPVKLGPGECAMTLVTITYQ